MKNMKTWIQAKSIWWQIYKICRLKADEISWFVIEKTRITVRELPDRLDNMQHYELGVIGRQDKGIKNRQDLGKYTFSIASWESGERIYLPRRSIANVMMARRRLKYDQSKEAIRKIYFELFLHSLEFFLWYFQLLLYII